MQNIKLKREDPHSR